jgi:hypothetical protein
LAFSGRLAEAFEGIKTEMEAKQLNEGGEQAGVDYIFEIPSWWQSPSWVSNTTKLAPT